MGPIYQIALSVITKLFIQGDVSPKLDARKAQ